MQEVGCRSTLQEVARPPLTAMFAKILRNRFIRKVLETEDPPERIARGVAVGSFIAVTPTIGLQIYLAVLLATLIRANRVAAVTMTFVLNPLIFVPPSYWYFPAYYIGTFILRIDGPGFSQIADTYGSSEGFFDLLGRVWSLGLEIYGPMIVGGVVMGVPLAFLMYKVSLRIVSRHRSEQTSTASEKPSSGAPEKEIADE